MYNHIKTATSYMLILWLFSSCNDFLEEKPEISVSVPESINDVRLLLDDASGINESAPGLIEMGSDDFELAYNTLMARPLFEQQIYLWDENPSFQARDLTLHWTQAYKCILISYVAEETLQRIDAGTDREKATLKGEALFIRALAYFWLAQVYAPPYVKDGDNHLPGIVYRGSSDFNEPSYRMTVRDSYDMILNCLLKSADLLPEETLQKTRPNKQAALALLARVYLSMEAYEKALEYADMALALGDRLIDFNTLAISNTNPFKPMSEEVIYHAICNSISLITASRSSIPDQLYQQYAENDLRKDVAFRMNAKGKYVYKGGYSGSTVAVFSGLAIDELYFIKAEAEARLGRTAQALNTINHLLQTRWKQGTYIRFDSSDPDEVLRFVLLERRKGLIYRGLRWSDLRRLNRDDRFKTDLIRKFEDNDLASRLVPNDKRYVFLIPQDVIQRAGLEQNPR